MYSSWNIPQEYKGACTGGDQVRDCGHKWHLWNWVKNKFWKFHSIHIVSIFYFWSKDATFYKKKYSLTYFFQDILQRTYPQLTIFDKSFVFVVNIEKGNLPNLKLRFWVLPVLERDILLPQQEMRLNLKQFKTKHTENFTLHALAFKI